MALLHVPRIWRPYLAVGGMAGLLHAAVMALAMIALTTLAGERPAFEVLNGGVPGPLGATHDACRRGCCHATADYAGGAR